MLHRVGDWLLKHCEILDRAVYASERELLGLSRTVVIYDSTNVHYCGYARGPLRGQAKHECHAHPLKTSAPTLDGIGFPQGSQMLRWPPCAVR